jgi:hypothetical protein
MTKDTENIAVIIIGTRQYYANRRFISIYNDMPKDGSLNLYTEQA